MQSKLLNSLLPILSIGMAYATEEAPAAETPKPVPVNEFVEMQEAMFHFKTDKLKDAEGKVIGDGVKLPSVKAYLPVPKASRLVQFFTDTTELFAKERALVMSALGDVVFGVARGQINDFREKNVGGVVTPAVINYDKLDFTAIANMPKSERGSYVPSDEDMKAFLESYRTVMPAITNKEQKKIDAHIDILATSFKKQRSQKEMLEFFQNALAMYVTNVGDEILEDHAEVVEYFQNKLKRMLAVEEKITMDDL